MQFYLYLIANPRDAQNRFALFEPQPDNHGKLIFAEWVRDAADASTFKTRAAAQTYADAMGARVVRLNVTSEE